MTATSWVEEIVTKAAEEWFAKREANIAAAKAGEPIPHPDVPSGPSLYRELSGYGLKIETKKRSASNCGEAVGRLRRKSGKSNA
jgi:hypothetical protein